MAVRIRKLAKELSRSSTDLIGVLHALGFQRYRSPDDMLPDSAESKLRQGLAAGVRPVAVDVDEVPVPSPLERLSKEADLMAQLVPGVVRQRDKRAPPAPARRAVGHSSGAVPVVEPPPPPPPAPPPVVEETGRSLTTEREALDSLRRKLDSERAVLEAERARLVAEAGRVQARGRALEAETTALGDLRAALDQEREALAAERHALATLHATQAAGARPLQELLEERGLRGADEFERALIALAHARLLRDVMWTIRLDPPDPLKRVLDDRLVLGAGEPHPALARGNAFVTVAPSRAEVPDPGTLHRLLDQLGERLLLFGCRRVRVVGGAPRWQRLLREGVDPRIELAFAPPSPRDENLAREDVSAADCVVLWNVEASPAARAIYGAARPVVVTTAARGLADLTAAIGAALQS